MAELTLRVAVIKVPVKQTVEKDSTAWIQNFSAGEREYQWVQLYEVSLALNFLTKFKTVLLFPFSSFSSNLSPGILTWPKLFLGFKTLSRQSIRSKVENGFTSYVWPWIFSSVRSPFVPFHMLSSKKQEREKTKPRPFFRRVIFRLGRVTPWLAAAHRPSCSSLPPGKTTREQVRVALGKSLRA